jgi:hypothetical protein
MFLNVLNAVIGLKVLFWRALKNPKNGFAHNAIRAKPSRFGSYLKRIPWKPIPAEAAPVAANPWPHRVF